MSGDAGGCKLIKARGWQGGELRGGGEAALYTSCGISRASISKCG